MECTPVCPAAAQSESCKVRMLHRQPITWLPEPRMAMLWAGRQCNCTHLPLASSAPGGRLAGAPPAVPAGEAAPAPCPLSALLSSSARWRANSRCSASRTSFSRCRPRSSSSRRWSRSSLSKAPLANNHPARLLCWSSNCDEACREGENCSQPSPPLPVMEHAVWNPPRHPLSPHVLHGS